MPAGELVTVPEPLPDLVVERVNVFWVKVAVTDLMLSIVTIQLPVPVHAPLHPANEELAAGVAVRVTVVPFKKLVWQLAPQLIAAGELVTVPEPVPDFDIVSANESMVKRAPTVLFPSIATVQLPVPVHAPLHPANKKPAAGVALSVTLVPLL